MTAKRYQIPTSLKINSKRQNSKISIAGHSSVS